MDRRTFALASLVTCAVPAGSIAAPAISRLVSAAKVEPQSFEFDEKAAIALKAKPVRWSGNDIHLVELAELTFSRDEKTKQLKAVAKGSLKTFDNVDYRISVAVFDKEDRMLGTAHAICKVPRIWLGVFAIQPVKLEFDFGNSNNFAQATKFLASISDQDVMTPDQWQK